MAINVKSEMNGTEQAATNAKGNLGVTLGAVALGLGVLGNNNVLGGILGGMGGNQECLVTKDMYYNSRIADLKEDCAEKVALRQELCGLQERIGKVELADAYQNEITKLLLNNVETRFGTERQVTNAQLDFVKCSTIQAEKVLPVGALAQRLGFEPRVIDTDRVAVRTPFVTPECEYAYDGGNACNGYRGF